LYTLNSPECITGSSGFVSYKTCWQEIAVFWETAENFLWNWEDYGLLRC